MRIAQGTLVDSDRGRSWRKRGSCGAHFAASGVDIRLLVLITLRLCMYICINMYLCKFKYIYIYIYYMYMYMYMYMFIPLWDYPDAFRV